MKLGSCIHLEGFRSTLCSILSLDLLFTKAVPVSFFDTIFVSIQIDRYSIYHLIQALKTGIIY